LVEARLTLRGTLGERKKKRERVRERKRDRETERKTEIGRFRQNQHEKV
jgi:hypothetical protein